jgi:hypothetical protein
LPFQHSYGWLNGIGSVEKLHKDVNHAASPPPRQINEQPSLLLTSLWQKLSPNTRDKILQKLGQIVAQQLLVPPNPKKEVEHEQR